MGAAAVMVTEYERKLLLWLTWVNYFFIPISLWYWYGQFTHLASKPPIPLMPEYQYMNGRKRDFSCHGGRWNDCKECRWWSWSSSVRRCATIASANRAVRSGASARHVRRQSAATEPAHLLRDAR